MAPSNNPRGQQAVDISAVFTTFAFIVVALRLYTRVYLIRCTGLEDYGIALAMLCSIGLTIAIIAQKQNGMGKHVDEVPHEEVVRSLKAFWASLIVYYLSLGLTKGSMLLQYRRIFPKKSFQIMNWTVMAVVISYTIWTVFSSIFACVPVRAFWTGEKATCLNQYAMWFTNAAINITTDFAIIILPIPVIRNLNLGSRQKMSLIGIFAVGGFVCIVSILRLQSLVAISNSTDATYDNPPAATWSSVETNVGIICACLPLLRPLLTHWLPGAFPSYKPSGASAPRHTLTYGSRSTPKAFPGKSAYDLELTKHSAHSSEDGRDIQVVTDIHVEVEGGSRSGWRTPTSIKQSSENVSIKEMGRANSTELLVEDAGRAI